MSTAIYQGVTVQGAPFNLTWVTVTCSGQDRVVLARAVRVCGYLSGCHGTGCTLYHDQCRRDVTGQDGVVLARGVRVNSYLVLSLPRALHKVGLFQRPWAWRLSRCDGVLMRPRPRLGTGLFLTAAFWTVTWPRIDLALRASPARL